MTKSETHLEGQLDEPLDDISLAETPYRYMDLEHPNSIRVIELHPSASPDDDLVANLVLVDNIEHPPEYEAISYTWGDPVFPERLHLDGGYLCITENLAMALRRFRLVDGVRRLWADAVCINQQNESEKIRQIGMMGQVFNRAVRVLVWLGPTLAGEDVTVSEAVEAIAIVLNDAEPLRLHQHGWRDVDYYNGIFKRQSGARHPNRSRSTKLSPRVAIYLFLEQSAWFSRAWVLQEVVLARELVLYHGIHTIPWSEFAGALLILGFTTYGTARRLLKRALSIVVFRARYHLGLITRNEQSSCYDLSVEVLRSQQARGCSCEHDRLLSVLGLLQQSSKPGEVALFPSCKPSYGDSIIAAYTKFAGTRFLQLAQPDLLFDAGLWQIGIRQVSGERLLDRGPSWLPRYDYRPEDVPSGEYHRDLTFHPKTFSSAVAKSAAIQWTLADLDLLKIGGVLLDTVKLKCDHKNMSLTPGFGGPASDIVTFLLKLGTFLGTNKLLDVQLKDEEIFPAVIRTAGLDFGEDMPVSADYQGKLLELQGGYELIRDPKVDRWRLYLDWNLRTMASFTIFMTQQGRLGCGPNSHRKGDRIAVFDGAALPYLVRHVSKKNAYTLVGPCYVYGIMYGELNGLPHVERQMISLI